LLCATILRGLTEELLGGRRAHGEDGGGEELALGGEDVSMRALDLANEAVSSQESDLPADLIRRTTGEHAREVQRAIAVTEGL